VDEGVPFAAEVEPAADVLLAGFAFETLEVLRDEGDAARPVEETRIDPVSITAAANSNPAARCRVVTREASIGASTPSA
jgi:hypothetical protein